MWNPTTFPATPELTEKARMRAIEIANSVYKRHFGECFDDGCIAREAIEIVKCAC